MKKLSYIKPKDHTDWLRLRKEGVGGSDAAAVVGLNSYVSPYALWMDKVGLTNDPNSPEEINEAMRQGTDLEEYVSKRFSERTGKKVRRRNHIIKNSDYPFAFANVDRWIVGENAGLECKTTSTLNLKRFKDGEFPANYYIQCLHYMAVTGADKYYLAVLVFGKEFLVFEIERDQELIDDLMTSEKAFWECVENETPPEVDGTTPTDHALEMRFDSPSDDQMNLVGDDKKIARLLKLKEDRKEMDTDIKKLEQELKEELGDFTKGTSDKYQITWKPQTRRSFQVKDFAKDHPDMDLEPYYKVSNSRVFRVKEL